MLERFLAQAERGPVFLSDVRAAFQAAEDGRPFHLQAELYDGTVRRFPLRLPRWRDEAERRFAASYVYASVYDLLSALGASSLAVYVDPADPDTTSLAGRLEGVFQTALPRTRRTGYGKCLNVNDRILSALSLPPFSLSVRDIAEERPVPPRIHRTAAPVFASLPGRAAGRLLLGIDVGGTDIKLAASVDGELAVCKEFDWSPASFRRADELTGPILLLARLMRAAASLAALGRPDPLPQEAVPGTASLETLARTAAALEREAGTDLRDFDAIGLSFPDVVAGGAIVGGETPKTQGIRENTDLDYEAEFAKISHLTQDLRAFVQEGGAVRCANDGPIAAFTDAVERAGDGAERGSFAHSLGTDLGSGWIRPDGSIPPFPLGLYDLIVDLGSFPQRGYPAEDVRSIANFSTSLEGTLQRYTSQTGVFRLAARDPELCRTLLDRGLFVRQGDLLVVPTAPRDLRKPCLEFLMDRAETDPACQEIFRQVGEALAAAWEETAYLLEPEVRERTLFGRLVKSPACFRLIEEGAHRRVPELVLRAADETLARTRLMRQLAERTDCTVAQFAQSVGAVYFGCLGLDDP